MRTSRIRHLAILIATAGAWSRISYALIINNGYTSIIDDRFTSGFPTAPVANTDPTFLGSGVSLSGVCWGISDPTHAAAALSPRHLLESNHYLLPTNAAGNTGSTIQFLADGTTTPINNYIQSNSGLAGVDLDVGTLGNALPSTIQVYSVLDVGSTNNYNGLSLLMYGRGTSNPLSSPRVGANVVAGSLSGSMGNQLYFSSAGTMPNLALPESGDSESPAFIPWTNPVSRQSELTLIGAQWTTAYTSFVADPTRYSSMNTIMVASGYSLLWTPSVIAATWLGGISNNWSLAANWSSGIPVSNASTYICFDPTVVVQDSSRTINIAADRTLDGIYFKAGTPGRPFTLSAGSIITIGRGGIVNYDSANQTINSILSFGDHQNWLAGAGGLTINGTLFNNGYLLSINTTGASALNGLLTGTGGLAKDGTGTLTISGSQTFTGPVFAHAGVINVMYPTGLSNSAISIDPGATVRYSQLSTTAAVVSSLALSAGGTLDVNSAVVMAGSSVSTRDALFASLKSSLLTGRNNGAWNGTGITSSLASAQDAVLGNQIYGVALVRNLDLAVPYDSATHPFYGVNVNPLYILMKYTYLGDTDLDGRITVDDYINVDISLLKHSPASWATGDFNYDGTVNYLDLALMDAAYFNQSGALADSEINLHAAEYGQAYLDAIATLGVIPEPASLLLLASGTLILAGRRRRYIS